MKVEDRFEENEDDFGVSNPIYTITIDGEEVFSIRFPSLDDEGNLDDCYKVKKIIEDAYKKGFADGQKFLDGLG